MASAIADRNCCAGNRFDGAVVAEASELVKSEQDISAHAELVAIRMACKTLSLMNLTGCTLITNVEPCWMCSYAIREAGITSLLIGRPIEDIGGVTSRFPILADTRIDGWSPPPSFEWYDLNVNADWTSI